MRYLPAKWVSFSHILPHDILLLGACISFLSADETPLVKINQRIVHQPHALLLSGLNNTGQHERFIFANYIGDSGCIGENLKREHAALSIFARYQLVTDNATQRFSDHNPDVFLLFRRKHIQ